MWTLIVIVLFILFIVVHKRKGSWSYELGVCLFICFVLECGFFGEWLFLKSENSKDVEYRENSVLMQEKQENMKREFIENGVLDDNSLNQFLEDYLELNEEIHDNNEVIKGFNNSKSKKEIVECMLFGK